MACLCHEAEIWQGMERRKERMGEKVIRTQTVIPQTGHPAWYSMAYKEPFTPLENGYGYEGVVLENETGSKVLCAHCGKWFSGISRTHLKLHGLTTKTYKERFGLFLTTPLLCTQLREKLSLAGSERVNEPWINRMNERRQQSPNGFKKANGRNIRRARTSAQFQNERSTCHLQSLLRLKAVAQKVGPDVSVNEAEHFDKGIVSILKQRFGTFNKAKEMANLICNHKKVIRLPREVIIADMIRFYAQYHRIPYPFDVREGLLTCNEAQLELTFKSHTEALKACGLPVPHAWGHIELPTTDIVLGYCSGKSTTDLAAQYFVSAPTINARLRRAGIPLRPPFWRMAKETNR